MANVCLKCKFSEVSEFDSPCTTCSYDAKTDKWSNFTPYKGLNEMLREKLSVPEPIPIPTHVWYDGNGTPVYHTIEKEDVVNKPSHYMLKPGLEVRDVIECLVAKVHTQCRLRPLRQNMPPLFEADYVQLMQYLMRFMDKNGVEDLRKAEFYLKKMIEAYDGDS